jgi:cysteine desulfurase family protein
MIYLDNAATTARKPQSVIDAVTRAMTGSVGNSGRGANEASLAAARMVYTCREQLARLFGFPSPACIAFTSNSTEALNTAIMGTLSAGDHVVTTVEEHNSVLRPLYFLKRNETRVDFVPIDKKGIINYRAMAKLVTPDTKAVVITHASNVTGNITDLAQIGGILRSVQGIPGTSGPHPLLIVDASQTAGSIGINAADIDGYGTKIDILCFTGHKALMGPQGTGGICVMPDVKVRPLKRGGSGIHSYDEDQPAAMPTVLEAGTLNAHGIAGLSAAVKFIEETGLEKIRIHEQRLTQRFYEGAGKIPDIRIYGDFSYGKDGRLLPRAPVVSINLGTMDSAELCDILSEEYGIATRAGAHCAPLVHKSFDTVNQGMVRFSFSLFTTSDDIDRALAALAAIQKSVQ